jgi:hypothetical protein
MEAFSTARALSLGLLRISLGFVDAAKAHSRPMIAATGAGKTANRSTLHAETRMPRFAPTGSALKPNPQFLHLRSALIDCRRSAYRFERVLPLINADPRDPYRDARHGGSQCTPGGARGAIDVTTSRA